MVKALKGDDVIEVKKRRFNTLEKKLLIILQIIIVTLLIATVADCIYSNLKCAEDLTMFVREYMEYVQCVTTLITGSLFIYNVKSLRSDTWKKQKLHTIILIVAIEITLIAQIVSVFKFAIPDHTDI